MFTWLFAGELVALVLLKLILVEQQGPRRTLQFDLVQLQSSHLTWGFPTCIYTIKSALTTKPWTKCTLTGPHAATTHVCVLAFVRPPSHGYCLVVSPTLLGHSVPCPHHNIHMYTFLSVSLYNSVGKQLTCYKSEEHATAPKGWTVIPDSLQNPWKNGEKDSAMLNCLNPGEMRKLKVPRLWKFSLDATP